MRKRTFSHRCAWEADLAMVYFSLALTVWLSLLPKSQG